MTQKLDKRLNAFRDDLADIELQDLIDAPKYVSATPSITAVSVASLRRGPATTYPVDKELLRGEKVHIFEDKDGWCWVQSLRDGYVGYCRDSAFTAKTVTPTHRVNVLRSLLFENPDLKTFVLGHLSLNAEVEVVESHQKFSRLSCGSWIFTNHLLPLGDFNHSFLDAAKLYLDAPYLWGGNNDLGLDCSGLIQMAALAAGHLVPRDADMQENHFTHEVNFSNGFDTLQIGDLLFWPGHVAIYTGDNKALHANATEMRCCYHDLDFLLPHIEKVDGTPLRSIKRPSFC